MPRSREDPYESEAAHSCWDHCYSNSRKRWDHKARAVRGCTRDDLGPVEWDVDVTLLRRFQGRDPDPELDAATWKLHPGMQNSLDQPWWRTPGEEPSEGCPAGWARCAFAESIVPYIRNRTEHGGRVENMRLSECEDRLVKDAALYYEDCEERLSGYRQRLIAQRMEADRKNGGRNA